MTVDFLAHHPYLISEIAVHLHREWGTLGPWSSLAAIEARLKERLNTSQTPFCLVATESEQLLGTASVRHFELPQHTDKKHWLAEVYVPPKQRGQGIGTRLIRQALETARHVGVTELYLYTNDQQELYSHLGWQELSTDKVNGEDISIMRLRL
jgi:N-acetylglutamate synthase-like GNAT family acetyltransferase